MNATQQYAATHGYLGSHNHHLSHNGAANNATSYATYQPPMLSTTHSSYAPSHGASYYPYSTASTMAPQHYSHGSIPSIASLPALPQAPMTTELAQPVYQPDPSGQTGPPGKRPKITATLWEDEGTLCFQVESSGICVARRADNCYINGTKLLNVANMTRGRRDGLLKGEKNRKVVKIGPMHLKGVWIPFERALEYANREKITDALYPLFVHNVEALLAQSGYTPTGAVAQRGATRDYGHVRTSSTLSHAPSMHSASSSISHIQPLNGHHANRPSIDRAHTFPTPPASATTAMAPVSATASYDWGIPAPHPAIEHTTALSTVKSLPTSPANTPPGNTLQQIQYPSNQIVYDPTRPMYSMPGANYTVAPIHHGYGKTEMPPPPSRKFDSAIIKDETETTRPDSGYTVNGSENYDRPNTYQGPLSSQQVETVKQRSTSPTNETPRPATAPSASQNHWQSQPLQPLQHQSTYTTPHRITTNDYRPMSAHSAQHSYSGSGTPQTFYYPTNGTTPTPASTKRLRDIDEEDEDHYNRPASQGGEYDGGLKRRRTVREGSDNVVRPFATPTGLNRARSMYQRR